jgi:hypothetical protein
VKTEYDSTRKKKKKNRIGEDSRRPEVQDADNSKGFVIQKELNVLIVITECDCIIDVN